MSISGPMVRDFTDRQLTLRTIVEADPVYEVLLASFVFANESQHSDYEAAVNMVDAVRAGADSELLADITKISGAGEVGLALLGIAHDLPAPRTVDNLVTHLREMDPARLRMIVMHCAGITTSHGHDEETIDLAAEGDLEAVHQLLAAQTKGCDVADLLETEPVAMRELIASVVERFAVIVGPEIDKWQPVRDRDAANTTAMAKTMSPDRLVEKVTNGVTFEMQPQVSGVLLIPSVIIRPWVVISEHGTLRVFAYSVSDEVLSADVDSPPAFLVDTFKALGDEKRLRILGVLAENDMGLKELAERVGVAKSTAHHHLRILRSAGLVRVIIGEEDMRYSLRYESIPEAGSLLESFLAARSEENEDMT